MTSEGHGALQQTSLFTSPFSLQGPSEILIQRLNELAIFTFLAIDASTLGEDLGAAQ